MEQQLSNYIKERINAAWDNVSVDWIRMEETLRMILRCEEYSEITKLNLIHEAIAAYTKRG